MLLRQYIVNMHNKDELEDLEYRGIIMGETYTEMIKKLEDYYGEDPDEEITEIDIYSLKEKDEIIPDGLIELESSTYDSL